MYSYSYLKSIISFCLYCKINLCNLFLIIIFNKFAKFIKKSMNQNSRQLKFNYPHETLSLVYFQVNYIKKC